MTLCEALVLAKGGEQITDGVRVRTLYPAYESALAIGLWDADAKGTGGYKGLVIKTHLVVLDNFFPVLVGGTPVVNGLPAASESLRNLREVALASVSSLFE